MPGMPGIPRARRVESRPASSEFREFEDTLPELVQRARPARQRRWCAGREAAQGREGGPARPSVARRRGAARCCAVPPAAAVPRGGHRALLVTTPTPAEAMPQPCRSIARNLLSSQFNFGRLRLLRASLAKGKRKREVGVDEQPQCGGPPLPQHQQHRDQHAGQQRGREAAPVRDGGGTRQ